MLVQIGCFRSDFDKNSSELHELFSNKDSKKTYRSLLAKLLGTCGSIICASGACMIILEHLSEDSEDGE